MRKIRSILSGFVILFGTSFISVLPAVAGTLEFDGVPVDITTADSEDLVIVPGTGGNVQIGNGSGTNTNATSNNDLHVTGVLEVDGAAYFDGGAVLGSNLIPSEDAAHSLGTSTKTWNNFYVTSIYAGDIAKIKNIAYSWPSAQGAAGTFLRNDGAGNLTWAASGGGSSLPAVDTTALVEGSADATKLARFEVDGLTTGTTRVMTVPDADGTLAVSATAPLSLNSTTGNLSLATVPIASGGTGTATAPGNGGLLIGKTDGSYTVANLTAGSNVTITNSDGGISIASSGGASLPVNDDITIAQGNVDNTKKVRLEVDGLTTGTTRVMTVPDADGTLAVSATAPITLSPAGAIGIGTVPLANGGTGVSLVDPNADQILFWDDSAGSTAFLTLGTNLSITGTTLNAAAASLPTVDTTSLVEGSSDITKQVRFEVDGLTTGNTRVMTVPDANGTLAVSASAPLSLNSTTGNLSLATVPIASGGTGTATAPTDGRLLIGKTDGSYAVTTLTAGSNVNIVNADGSVTISTTSGAPTTSKYLIQTPDAALTSSQALSTLSTGILTVTTATGVVSSVTNSAGLAGQLSDETGSGNVVLGTTPTLTTPVIKGESVVTLADAATIATDASLGNVFTVESAVDRTLGAPTNPTTGQKCIWRWKNVDSSAHSMSLTTGAGGFRFGTSVQGTSATPAGRTDYIGAIYNATDNRWDVIAYAKGYN